MTEQVQLGSLSPPLQEGPWRGWSFWTGREPFEELVGPFYTRREKDGSYTTGFRPSERNLNSTGILHGGAIATFADEDEAVRLANDTDYGLVSYVFTQDLARGHRLIDRLETGMMGLNVGVVSNAAAPFGGVKQSGIGREGGPEGIHEFLSTKYTLIPAD